MWVGVRLLEQGAQKKEAAEQERRYGEACDRLRLVLRCTGGGGDGDDECASQGAAGVGGPGAEAGDAFTIADGDGSQMEGIDEHVAADDGRDVRGRCHVHLLRDLKHLAKLRGAGEQRAA